MIRRINIKKELEVVNQKIDEMKETIQSKKSLYKRDISNRKLLEKCSSILDYCIEIEKRLKESNIEIYNLLKTIHGNTIPRKQYPTNARVKYILTNIATQEFLGQDPLEEEAMKIANKLINENPNLRILISRSVDVGLKIVP